MAFVPYRQLDVFKRCYALALEIHRATEVFPKQELYGGMADQMRRASKSVCANIAEGLGKGGSKAEQARFLRIAMGSIEEMRLWFMFCNDLGYIEENVFLQWDNEYEQLSKMLGALVERRLEKRNG